MEKAASKKGVVFQAKPHATLSDPWTLNLTSLIPKP